MHHLPVPTGINEDLVGLGDRVPAFDIRQLFAIKLPGMDVTRVDVSGEFAKLRGGEVLGYKKMYEHAQAEELEKLGIKHKKPVSKCVIVLGTCIDDQVWRENFDRVCATLCGIELLTYNHLIDRLDNTIRNLEENTRTI